MIVAAPSLDHVGPQLDIDVIDAAVVAVSRRTLIDDFTAVLDVLERVGLPVVGAVLVDTPRRWLPSKLLAPPSDDRDAAAGDTVEDDALEDDRAPDDAVEDDRAPDDGVIDDVPDHASTGEFDASSAATSSRAANSNGRSHSPGAAKSTAGSRRRSGHLLTPERGRRP